MTADAPAAPRVAPSRARRFASWLHAHPGARLRLLLAGPLFWMVVIYLGSLAILLLNAFWTSDSFTGKVNSFDWSLDAFRQIFENEAYRTIGASVQIPGFRKGKVPSRIIDQRVGRGAVVQEAVNEALPRFFAEAAEAEKSQPEKADEVAKSDSGSGAPAPTAEPEKQAHPENEARPEPTKDAPQQSSGAGGLVRI